MNILYRLEKKFGRYSIPNLTYYLILGQVLAFIIKNLYPAYGGIFTLVGQQLFMGQWWRIITFLFNPISDHFLFVVFSWYLFYMYGTALERLWGSFRYLVYILISYLATVLLAFVFPYVQLSNGYMYSSVFLAFAYLFPDFTMLLFFVLPIKIKWLAIVVWLGILSSVLFGSIPVKILTIVSLINFFIFFGEDVYINIRNRARKVSKTSPAVGKRKAYHICAVCGKNEVDTPDMQIRYCSKCNPSLCYCEDHITKHTHKIVN